MESYLIYIGKTALAAGAFYLAYLMLFQNQKQFAFNRIYLPVSLALSFFIPLITFTSVEYIEPTQALDINSFAYLENASEIPAETTLVLEWYHYLFALYILGAAGFLFFLLLGHAKAISIVKKSRLKKLFEIKVNITKKDVHPFSFFHKIVLSEKTLKNPNLKLIVEHENIHVKEKHTFDILFSELLFLLQWFNPFAWLIKDAIKNNLEYKTDQQITETHNPQAYQLAMVGLADKKGVAPFLTALNGSQLKNRIIMMKKKTENKYALLKQLLVLPLLAILVMGLSNREVKTEIVPTANQVEILNAGKVINGKVTDPNGDPVSGASILVKGKTIGTITNSEGQYQLELSDEDEILVFIMAGFEKLEIPVNDLNKIDVQLKGEKTVKINSTSNKTFTKKKEYEHTVKGKVIDQNGDPVSGATIIVKGKTTGTITDVKGNYEIGLDNDNETLVFMVQGSVKKEVKVEGKSEIDVKTEKITAHDVLYGDPSLAKHKEKKFEISGRVTDKNGDPVAGSSVLLKNKTIGTVTNKQGYYLIGDDEEIGTLVFVKNGYKKQEVDLEGKQKIDVQLQVDKNSKTDQGKVTGYKNDSEIIKIRPDMENPPLFVVDGKEVDDITDLDPADLESISVLKDASATSLYGDKGKSGVILITTKEAAQKELSKALVIVDGKEFDGDVNDINPDNIKNIDVLKNESATRLYGEKAKDGAIIISTINKLKHGENSPLIIIDGVQSDKDVNDINPETIQSINVLKDESATEKYGTDGKNGVIEISLKKPDELTQNEIPVVLNGKPTDKKLNEIDRDLIDKIKRLDPEEATKKYGDFGKFGVLEVNSRNVYTENVKVKSTSENDKIDTDLKLRKFFAYQIKYPVKAQEAGMTGTASVLLEIDKNGKVKIGKQYPDIRLEEVVVKAYKQSEKSVELPKKDILEKEAERVAKLLKQVDIDNFKGKTVLVTVKFEVQD